MPGCCAVKCKNRSERGFRLFRFPADTNRHNIWIAKVGRDFWAPTTSSKLCEDHFDPSQFEQNRLDGRKLLKPNAIPEIFAHRLADIVRKPPVKRELLTNDLVLPEQCSPKGAEEAFMEIGKGGVQVKDEPLESAENIPEHCSDDKDETIRRLKAQVLSLQRKVKKLESCLDEATRSLNIDHIEALHRNPTRGHKWSYITVKNDTQLCFSCGIKGYNSLLKSRYPLQIDRTLS